MNRSHVNPENQETLLDRFRVFDREKLELAIALCKTLEAAGLPIRIAGPSQFLPSVQFVLNQLCGSPIKSFFGYDTVEERDANWVSMADTQVLDFKDFGLYPLVDYEVAYYELWQGRVPSNVGRLVVVEKVPLVPVPNIINEELRTIDGLRKIYKDGKVPVELVSPKGMGGGAVDFGTLDLGIAEMRQYVPMSHAQFIGTFKTPPDWITPKVMSDGCQINDLRLILNPGQAPELFSKEFLSRIIAIPLAFNALRGQLGIYHYGAGVDEKDLQSASGPAIQSYAKQFHAKMAALPENTKKVVLHLPQADQPFDLVQRSQNSELQRRCVGGRRKRNKVVPLSGYEYLNDDLTEQR